MTENTRDIAVALRNEVLPHDAKRYGVVIGIDRYRDERLNLRCARADAEAIRNLMIDPECGLFEEDQVTLLLDDAAIREQIWRALAGLRRKTRAHDSVWIFYAGHGAPEGDDFYWVPHDGDVDDLYSTGLSRRDLNRVLGDIHAERIVAFMDCCHAAAMGCQKNKTREVITAEKALAAYQGKGRLIFAASDGQEKSVEIADQGRGAFSYFLEQGLRGEADTARSGVVTADGLWLYLKDKVTNAAQAAGNPQSPVRIGEETHDFALSLNPLEFGRRKRIAEAINSMVGVGADQLSTEEGRICLDLLRRGPRTDAEHDLAAEFDSLVSGALRVTTLRRLIAGIHDEVSVSATPQKQSRQDAAEPVDDKSSQSRPPVVPFQYREERTGAQTHSHSQRGQKTREKTTHPPKEEERSAEESNQNKTRKMSIEGRVAKWWWDYYQSNKELALIFAFMGLLALVVVIGIPTTFIGEAVVVGVQRHKASSVLAEISRTESGYLRISGEDFAKLQAMAGIDFMKNRLVAVAGVIASQGGDGGQLAEFFSTDGRMKYMLDMGSAETPGVAAKLVEGKPVTIRGAVHRYKAGVPILRVVGVDSTTNDGDMGKEPTNP